MDICPSQTRPNTVACKVASKPDHSNLVPKSLSWTCLFLTAVTSTSQVPDVATSSSPCPLELSSPLCSPQILHTSPHPHPPQFAHDLQHHRLCLALQRGARRQEGKLSCLVFFKMLLVILGLRGALRRQICSQMGI